MISKKISFVILFQVLCCSKIFSTELPDAGIIYQQQKNLDSKVEGAPIEIERQNTKEKTKNGRSPNTIFNKNKIIIKKITYKGDIKILSEKDKKNINKEIVYTPLTFYQLNKKIKKLTKELRNKGYIIGRIYLAPQDISNGTLEISIIGGRLDGSIKNKSGWFFKSANKQKTRINLNRLKEMAEHNMPSGEIVKKDKLERTLLLVNDLPTIDTRSYMEPGEKTGTTRMVVSIHERKAVEGNIWVNNYGSKATGNEQFNSLFSINTPGRIGDQVQIQATISEGLGLGRLSYFFPIGYSGFQGNLDYTYMSYKAIEGIGKDLKLSGDLNMLGGGISYPIIRSRTLNVFANANYHYKRITNNTNVGLLNNKRINNLIVSIYGDWSDRWLTIGQTFWDISLTRGRLDILNDANQMLDTQSLNAQGNYWKLNYSINRLQQVTGNLSLLASFTAQLSNRNLDSSEKFLLGGPNGVKAYTIDDGNGDEGWLAHLELRQMINTPAGKLFLGVFLDSGKIKIHKNTSSLTSSSIQNNIYAHSIGLSANLTKIKNFNIKATWSHSLDTNNQQLSSNNRFWLQGMFSF